jgi:hypothetical protein
MRVIAVVVAIAAIGGGVAARAETPEALAQRISHDQRQLERLGIYVTSIAPDAESDRVEVDVITRRSDAQAVMQQRYGSQVRVKVVARRRFVVKRTRVGNYEPLPGGRAIRVVWLTNSAFDLVRVRAREGRRRVVVTILERVWQGNNTMAGEQRVKTLKLGRPLGTRAVIDGATGKVVASSSPAAARP